MSKTIYIVGLGLIGGSIALGIRRDHPDYLILGYNRDDDSKHIAIERQLVDEMTSDLSEFAGRADIIILAVPIKQTLSFIQELSQLPLKENVIITDTGSTKLEIMQMAEVSFKDKSVHFVGGHPMAGSHKSGAIAADVNLFENAYYILTPSEYCSSSVVGEIESVLSGLHACFMTVDAKEHDVVTSQISHFPHVIASSLMEQAGHFAENGHSLTNHFAAGGFRDMTRIAESDAQMWTSILLSNPESVIDRIRDFKERLDRVATLITQGDEEAIWHFFHQGKLTRQKLEIHKRGGVDSFFDLFIHIPDKEDVVLQILELLRGISLVNLRINEENREDINGILQISFKSAKDLEKAKTIISGNTDYPLYTN